MKIHREAFDPEVRSAWGAIYRDLNRNWKRFRKVMGNRHFLQTYLEWRRQGGSIDHFRPILDEHKAKAGYVDSHYFNQDILVAQQIFENKPQRHVDVGSRLDGFVAHVASFRPIEVFDIRPVQTSIPNITFRQMDLTQLDPAFVACCDSLSCLHVLEHFGLGRYGDPVDVSGHLKGFANLLRILRPGGTLYVSFPIGRARVEYNANRVFDPLEVLSWPGAEKLTLQRFDFIDDAGKVHLHDTPQRAKEMNLNYGCGIYTFIC